MGGILDDNFCALLIFFLKNRVEIQEWEERDGILNPSKFYNDYDEKFEYDDMKDVCSANQRLTCSQILVPAVWEQAMRDGILSEAKTSSQVP